MAEKESPSSPPPSSPAAPTNMLPASSSDESFIMSGSGMSPGPMALASSFFPDDDADSDSRWLSQVFGGAESSTAVVGPSFGPEVGDMFMSQQNGPAEFLVSQQPAMSPVPPGLSPHSFLDSPGVFTSSQGRLEIPLQHFLAQHIQSENPHSSAAPPASSLSMQHNAPPPMPDHDIDQESTQLSHSDLNSLPSYITVDKSTLILDDVFNWHKYAERPVKGYEYPRLYYRCRHADCHAKKNVQRGSDGQISEIEYRDKHKHSPPHKPAKDKSDQESSDSEEGLMNPRKEIKIIIRTTSEVELLDDGYDWKSCGQKDIRGSPHQLIYFRCTKHGCNVGKQVEWDPSAARAVKTTYKGNHDHEAPVSMKSSRSTANAERQMANDKQQ